MDRTQFIQRSEETAEILNALRRHTNREHFTPRRGVVRRAVRFVCRAAFVALPWACMMFPPSLIVALGIVHR